MKTLKAILIGLMSGFLILTSCITVKSQESLDQLLANPTNPQAPSQPAVAPPQFIPNQPAPQASADKKNPLRFHFFWVNEEKIKQREEHKNELKDLKIKQKQETEALIKKIKEDKIREEALNKKVMDKQIEVMAAAQKIIDKRESEVNEVKESKNVIEVISKEEDPLFIKKAQVLGGSTSFMKIKDVELKYQLELHNQTPKIINFALIIWERKLAFNDSQTLAREIKIAKPLTPYEKRIVDYNELDSQRQGETYSVKIAKIVFEDGTQWKNPVVKDNTL